MKGSYDDIVSRIADPILWYDEHGVPRYAPFAPECKANVDADEAALVEVACQHCRRAFFVCCSSARGSDRAPFPLAGEIRANNAFLYDEPPRHTTEIEARTGMDGCADGEAMKALGIRVIEYWRRVDGTWLRDPTLETAFLHGDAEARRIVEGKW